MMESPSTEAVLKEVYALYNNPDSTEKEKASKWLEQFQKSIHSWKIANQLLQDKYDMHSCYFAAQTMRSKIQNSFHELPATAHESLRNSLLEHISHITNDTNQIIVTQLCLALADLTLLMASWQKPIPDLLELFSAKPNSMNALIVILTFIPEEINSRYLRLGANRREEILAELRSNSATVAEFLQCSLQNYGQTNESVQMKIVKCFTSWISVDAIKLKDVTENMILSYSFSMLINQHCDTRIHDIASDCLCAVIQCSESGNGVDAETEKKIFNGIAALEEAYHISVAHEDLNKSINFCRIFTVLAETFLHHMVDNNKNEPHYSIKALDLVLNCVGHYDFEVAEISFSMWYKLSEELYHKNSDALTSIFKPYVERLIVAVYKHCQMEPDHEGLIEDQDVFQDFRFKVSELIKDVIFISSSSNCFKQMFMILKTPSVTWESSEAALFIMENVARNILPEENEIVPQVMMTMISRLVVECENTFLCYHVF
jgi:transportin-3